MPGCHGRQVGARDPASAPPSGKWTQEMKRPEEADSGPCWRFFPAPPASFPPGLCLRRLSSFSCSSSFPRAPTASPLSRRIPGPPFAAFPSSSIDPSCSSASALFAFAFSSSFSFTASICLSVFFFFFLLLPCSLPLLPPSPSPSQRFRSPDPRLKHLTNVVLRLTF